MHAKEAYDKSVEVCEKLEKENFKIIDDAIDKAISAGRFKCRTELFNMRNENEIIKKYRSLGFHVRTDNLCNTIELSWNK